MIAGFFYLCLVFDQMYFNIGYLTICIQVLYHLLKFKGSHELDTFTSERNREKDRTPKVMVNKESKP